MDSENVGNSWMSATPRKPILTRSELNPPELDQIETSTWHELLGIYGGLLQEETTSKGVELQNSPAAIVSPAVVGERNGYISNNASLISNSHKQNDGNWSGNQDSKMNSYQKNVYNTSQEAKDAFPIPYWPFNTLYSPLRAESGQASASSSFQLAPATPLYGMQMQNKQPCNIQHSPADQTSNWISNQQKAVALSVQQNNVESFHNDFVSGILESSAGGITASPVENQPYKVGNHEGVDLNRTPNQSTPAKRRKHRPKVVREGKQKGTPNATTPLPTPATTPLPTPTIITNSENQSKKRKYVRRKNIQASTSQTKNTAEETKISEIQSASKPCRKLNFDLEEVTDGVRDQRNDSTKKEQEETGGLINLNSKDQDSYCRAVNINDLASVMFKEKQRGYNTLEQNAATSTAMPPTKKMLIGMSSLLTTTAAACTTNNHTLNAIAKSMWNTSHYQPISQNRYNILGESLGQIVQTNPWYESTDRTSPLPQGTNMFNRNEVNDQRRWKRPYYQTADALDHNELNPLNSSQWLRNQMGNNNNTTYYVGSSKISSRSPETAEKLKLSDACEGNDTRLPWKREQP